MPMPQYPRLTINRNFNGKLYADSFTVLEKYDADRQVGHVYSIYLGTEFQGTAQLRCRHRYLASQVTEFVSYLVFGWALPQAQSHLKQSFGKKVDAELDLLLLVWIARSETSSVNVDRLKDDLKIALNPSV